MFVKLQRPPPEIRIFLPAASFRSRTRTDRPRFAASMAHISPAAPAPTTTTSTFTCGSYRGRFLRWSSNALLVQMQRRQVAVEQCPVILHAPVFHQFVAGFHSCEDSAVLDGLGVDFRILPGHLVAEMLRVDVADAFDDVQRVARWMFGRVDVRLSVERDGIDDERVAFPLADG